MKFKFQTLYGLYLSDSFISREEENRLQSTVKQFEENNAHDGKEKVDD